MYTLEKEEEEDMHRAMKGTRGLGAPLRLLFTIRVHMTSLCFLFLRQTIPAPSSTQQYSTRKGDDLHFTFRPSTTPRAPSSLRHPLLLSYPLLSIFFMCSFLAILLRLASWQARLACKVRQPPLQFANLLLSNVHARVSTLRFESHHLAPVISVRSNPSV